MDTYDLFLLKMEMEEEGFIPHGISIGKNVLSLEDDSKFGHKPYRLYNNRGTTKSTDINMKVCLPLLGESAQAKV